MALNQRNRKYEFDDDGNGFEDRYQNTTFALEDDFVTFGMFHAYEVECCCSQIDYGVRIEAVSPGLRLWSGGRSLSVGDTCGACVSVEGTAANNNAYVRYSVLDGIPTNEVTVGILRNGTAQTLDLATNTTSVVLKYISQA